MARRQQASSGGGCPDYMLTYGDMMSLLLCFFIMIFSLSQIKEEERFKIVLDSLKKAFGYSPSSNAVPGDKAPFNAQSIVERIKDQIVRRNRDHKASDPQSRKQQQFGRSTTVRMIREGMVFTVGGLSLFDEGSATLREESHEDLLEIIEPIRGYRNKIEIRGHTSRKMLPKDSQFDNKMDLSYARAAVVSNFMIAQGIEQDRITLQACGGNEPVRLHANYREAAAQNDRVEIIIKDTMVQDYEGPAGSTDQPTSDEAQQ